MSSYLGYIKVGEIEDKSSDMTGYVYEKIYDNLGYIMSFKWIVLIES